MSLLRGAAVLGVVLALAGCSQTTNGKVNRSVQVGTLPVQSPTFPSPTDTVTLSVPTTSSPATPTTSSAPLHPVPSTPIRTATFDSNGRHYVIKIWAEVKDANCAEHAYGQVEQFLIEHPCRGLTRQLATTTVNSKAVGFDVAMLSIPGPDDQHPYEYSAQFHTLVDADGTGNINDLMREGWRLPSGPTAVPQPNAFRSLAQDTGINIYDMWYLSGPTPDNDPPLLQMAQDIYLAY